MTCDGNSRQNLSQLITTIELHMSLKLSSIFLVTLTEISLSILVSQSSKGK